MPTVRFSGCLGDTAFDQVRYELYDLLQSYWLKPELSKIVGYAPFIKWQGIYTRKSIDESVYSLSVSAQFVFEKEIDKDQNQSYRRFKHYGLLFVMVFAPCDDSESFVLGGKLADHCVSAYAGVVTDSGVSTKNCRVNDISGFGGSRQSRRNHRCNVVVDFEFIEIRSA